MAPNRRISNRANNRRLTQAIITGLRRGFLEYVAQYPQGYTRIISFEQELECGSQCRDTARATALMKDTG